VIALPRPRLLDLFCGQGGAAAGYAAAGFIVVGVDNRPQPRYPFAHVEADALEYVRRWGWRYDVIHASPPCQAHSITKHTHKVAHPDLVAATREALQEVGRTWVIENVVGAPLRDPLTLCGTMFDLTAYDPPYDDLVYLRRHRLFESSTDLTAPGKCLCAERNRAGMQCAGSYGAGSKDRHHARHVRHGGYTPSGDVRRALLGTPWMTIRGCDQAIPPAYTCHLGRQLRRSVIIANGG
jgi:DNA (cytosine-5)-methyltransferase 1